MNEAAAVLRVSDGYAELDRCLVCNSVNLRTVLDLGDMPLANAFHKGEKPQEKYPLAYCVCRDCYHGQLSVAVNPHLMFDNYLYVSGTTRTLRAYFQDFTRKVEKDFGERKLRVLEIGCNDGTLLKEFQDRGHWVLGVDPAENLEDAQEDNGITVVRESWLTSPITDGANKWDAIIAMNVLAHAAEPVEFLKLCKRVLAPGGRIYVQTSQAMMLLNGEFDTIYHEHISYFTANSFMKLGERAGLQVSKMSYVPVHGKSCLVEFVSGESVFTPGIFDVMHNETRMGYYTPEIYTRFAELAAYKKAHAVKMIDACRANGYLIAGYGAAAKGMTFLNYTGIELEAVVDDNPLKVDKLCPGNDAPVVDSEWMAAASEKICWLILAWNFADEIIERIRNARPDAQDLFMTCFPRSVMR